ncbi:hypothetical protein V1478_011038, partial [Vespula squamosa]
ETTLRRVHNARVRVSYFAYFQYAHIKGVYRKIDTSGNASRLNNIFRLEELKVANRFGDTNVINRYQCRNFSNYNACVGWNEGRVQPILHTQLELSYEPISLDVSGYRIWP